MESSSFTAKLIGFLTAFTGWKAYLVILGTLTICGLGVPLPEDITLIAAGILAGLGNISLTGALIAGFIGVMIGDTILYFAGRKFGHQIFEIKIFKRIFTPERIALAERKVLNNSKFICFTARFLPGLRSAIFLSAGVLGVRPIVFFGLDGLAAFFSVPIWVVGGWWFANHLDEALVFAEKMQFTILFIIVIFIASYFFMRRWKGRRRAISAKK